MTPIDVHSLTLDTLPSVALSDRALLPAVPGVYVAYSPTEVLYVGRGQRISDRWRAHNRYPQLAQIEGVRIAWIECENVYHLQGLEQRCISHFRPSLNIQNVTYRATDCDGDRQMQIRLTSAQRRKLKADAVRLGLSQTQLISEALRQFDATRWLIEHAQELAA